MVQGLLRGGEFSPAMTKALRDLPEDARLEKYLETIRSDTSGPRQGLCFSTAALLEKRNLRSLVHKLSQVEYVAHFCVPYLVRFLSLGGSMDQIDIADVREFYGIMEGHENDFKLPLLGRDEVSAGDLHSVVEWFADLSESPFLKSIE